MRYLSLAEVLELHRRLVEQSGGGEGLRDAGLLESAVSQPQMTFGGQDLCPTLAEKAAALCFALIQNHPFVDGNKRIAHAAMETFLVLNGCELQAEVDQQERIIMNVAAGRAGREDLQRWIGQHLTELRDA
jgi:death on curing protein